MIHRRSADTGISLSVNVSAELGLVSGVASIAWFHYLVGALDRFRSAHSIQAMHSNTSRALFKEVLIKSNMNPFHKAADKALKFACAPLDSNNWGPENMLIGAFDLHQLSRSLPWVLGN